MQAITHRRFCKERPKIVNFVLNYAMYLHVHQVEIIRVFTFDSACSTWLEAVSMYSIRRLSSCQGSLKEGNTSSIIGAIIEMSCVNINLGSSAHAIVAQSVTAEDLGLGSREVGDLAIVGDISGVSIKRHSGDLVLNG